MLNQLSGGKSEFRMH